MSHFKHVLALAGGLLVISGCSTSSPNPSAPKANTAYVDFYTDSSLDLIWQIKRADSKKGDLRTVFSDYEPVQGTLLRLAAPPGTQQFEVWIVNRITTGPQPVRLQMMDGKITPVHITLTSEGTNYVQTKVYGFRPSAKGYGRGTKITREQEQVYQIGVAVEDPVAYRVKQQMPYYQPGSK